MAYMCDTGFHKECTGCGKCKGNHADYSDEIEYFNKSLEEICENIDDNLQDLKFLLQDFCGKDIDELQEDLKVVEKALKEMRSGLDWIY